FTLPSNLGAGPYYLIVSADDSHVVNESGESNNTYAIPITVTAPVKPDLVVSSITPATTSVSQGADLSFSYVIQNSGGLSAGSSYAGFYVDQKPDTAHYAGYNLTAALAANASVTLGNTL